MRYAYQDLGEQKSGSIATVRWSGGRADVLLLDPVSFSKYQRQKQLVFRGAGGHYRHSPARLSIPEDGRWYVVVDLRGYSKHAEATVEIRDPNAREPQQPQEQALAEVG